MRQAIPHSRFKAKVLLTAAAVNLVAIWACLVDTDAAPSIGTIAGAFDVFAAALVGARAWHQASAAKTHTEEP